MKGKRFESNVSAVTRFQLEEETETKFGWCGYYPNWLQRFATPRTFLICFCIKNILQGMIFSYLVGIETSLERHFQFDGRSVGLLLTLGEIGPILTAVFISHMGSHGNRPRWMGGGLVIISVALVLAWSTNLIFPPPRLDVAERINGSISNPEKFNSKILCHSQEVQKLPQQIFNSSFLSSNRCTINSNRRQWAFASWVLVYSVMGIGGTTVYTIGAPYLDDSISNKESPFYFSITMAVRAIGPVFGNLISSACLRFYVDMSITPSFRGDDPRWIGAWWLGLLILASALAVYAVVMAAFPRRMPSGKNMTKQRDQSADIPSTISVSMTSLEIDDKSRLTKKQRMRGIVYICI